MLVRRCPKSFLRRALLCGAYAALAFACAPPTAASDDAPLAIPFTVSDHFDPTGYLGDGATIGNVNMVAADCPTRAPNPLGDCYHVTYNPPNPGANFYAGVFWQYPGNNWGDYYGHTILPGATKATVWARSEKGGEQVVFKVGGIAPTNPANDKTLGFAVSAPPVTLTTQWAEYTVDFGGAPYNEVLGGFAWVINLPTDGSATAPIVFYLDSIRWSQ